MKNTLFRLITLIVLFFLTSCQKQEPVLPETTPEETFSLEALIASIPVDPNEIALEILGKTHWPQTEAAPVEKTWVRPGKVLSAEKTYITEDIVHYAFVIAGGSGEHDKIGLHRVVKETSGGKPIKTYKTLFYQHGDAKNFTGMMLPGQLSPNTADDFGMAVYLAQNDIDVWGIDQAWTFVPEEITDHSFMADWGVDRQVRDLRIAMAVARVLRFRTGNGVGKMLLAGYSSGGATGFATVNEEALLASPLRSVKGFIAIDLPMKVVGEALNAYFVSDYEYSTGLIESGEYGYYIIFKLVAELARSNPDDDSPVFPGLTNKQATLFLGAGNIYGEATPHFLAGAWEDGLPVELEYVTLNQWLDFQLVGTPWEAARFIQDYCMWIAGVKEVPWDDHFSEISIPILSVNPVGGFGRENIYGTTFLGSKDITQLNIQLRDDDDALYDFAHIDLFIAHNAEEVAWKPILDWIKTH